MSATIDRATAFTVKAPPFGRFFLPGPTEVRHDLLYAMTQQMVGHRGKDIEELLSRVGAGLQPVFRTNRPVYTVTSSATGLMEAGVRNATRKRVLCLVNGSFSERFHKACVNSGIPADVLEVPYGQIHTPELLADALALEKYDVVTAVHSETSTGALNPIRELAEVAHDSGDVAIVVDAVSSLAASPVETDAWGLDYVLTGSQKAMALPPGLAFCTANERVFERARAGKGRGLYFDLLEFDEYHRKNQTPNTPAVSLLYALDLQLTYIAAEGVEARWARHQTMAQMTWEWVDARRERGIDVRVFAPKGFRSHGVTCITMPEGKPGSLVAAAMRSKGFVIATGYGPLRDKMIRIGHMGDHTADEVDAVLEALDEVLMG